jgi:magnesium-transporting ATPase (P-type)
VKIDGAGSDSSFFTAIVAVMSIVPVALPIVIKVFMKLAASGREDAQEMKDALERANEDLK